jgi:hypothetical protein
LVDFFWTLVPMVSMSGSKLCSFVYPPGPAHIVWVSSMIRRVPVCRVNFLRASWNPGCGWTIPESWDMQVSNCTNVGHRRFTKNAGDISLFKSLFQSWYVVEFYHLGCSRGVHRWPNVSFSGWGTSILHEVSGKFFTDLPHSM